jgi:flavorubredoxin
MKPNAKSVTTALRKVAGLNYNTIANGHGPVLR